jgi:HEAT repeats
MPTIMTIRLHIGVGKMLRLFVMGALLGGIASGQQAQGQAEKLAYGADKANVPDAIAKVKSGEFGAVHVDMRDKDDTYWDSLVKLVAPALESDAPDFMSYDSQGKAVSGPSPQLVAWADAHNLPHAGLLEESRYLLPGKVMIFGWSRDPRAIPLLRRALSSPNYMVEIAAAMGLAEIGDKESIPFIIDACRKAPADVAAVIARALVYFDDNSAQSAVDQFIPKDIAKIERDAKARGDTKPLSPPLYDKLPNQ